MNDFGKLVRRTNSKTLRTFLGCSEFPECRLTAPDPAEPHNRRCPLCERMCCKGECEDPDQYGYPSDWSDQW